MGVQLLTEINGKPWAVQPEWYGANAALIASVLRGDMPYTMGQKKEDAPAGMLVVAGSGIGTASMRDLVWGEKIAPNSVFVMPIEGPIVRTAECAYGTMDYARFLNMAAADPNIDGAILAINSPGGVVWGMDILTQAMEDFKATGKPLATWVNNGMAASAAYNIFCHGELAMLGHRSDMVGSIGTMITLTDITGMLKKEGIVQHEIYAPQSKDKNAMVNNARKGDYTGIQEMLAQFCDAFISNVKARRPDIADSVFTGKTYLAEEALSLGMADGMCTLAELVQIVSSEAAGRKRGTGRASSTTLNSENNMFQTFKAVKALKGAEATADLLAAANAELAAEGISAAELVAAGTAEATQQQITSLQENLNTATARVEELEASLATLTTERDNLQAEVEQLREWKNGAGAEATTTTTNKPDKVTQGEEQPAVITSVDDDPFSQSILNKYK